MLIAGSKNLATLHVEAATLNAVLGDIGAGVRIKAVRNIGFRLVDAP